MLKCITQTLVDKSFQLCIINISCLQQANNCISEYKLSAMDEGVYKHFFCIYRENLMQ